MVKDDKTPQVAAFVWKALWAALAVIAGMIGYSIRDGQQRQARIEQIISDHKAKIQVHQNEIEHLKDKTFKRNLDTE